MTEDYYPIRKGSVVLLSNKLSAGEPTSTSKASDLVQESDWIIYRYSLIHHSRGIRELQAKLRIMRTPRTTVESLAPLIRSKESQKWKDCSRRGYSRSQQGKKFLSQARSACLLPSPLLTQQLVVCGTDHPPQAQARKGPVTKQWKTKQNNHLYYT